VKVALLERPIGPDMTTDELTPAYNPEAAGVGARLRIVPSWVGCWSRWRVGRPRGMVVGMKSRVHPTYKTHYRVGNWRVYERALVSRGDVTLWLSPDARAA